MTTLNETWDGIADGSIERPDQPAILRVLINRARNTAGHQDDMERFKALRVGKVVGGPESIQVYKEFTRDTNKKIRELVFTFALEVGIDGLSIIRALVKDEDIELNHRVLSHLFEQNEGQSATAVRGLLVDPLPLRRAWAALITGSTAGASMLMRIQPLQEDPNAEVVAAAQWALANINNEEVGPPPLPTLQGCAGQTSSTAKALPVPVTQADEPKGSATPPPNYSFEDIQTYFHALGEAQEPSELAKHIRSYSDSELSAGLRDSVGPRIAPSVKRGAALAAARTGNTRWAGTLRKLVKDTHPGVRAAVAEALGVLCTNGVSVQLAQMLTDEHDSVRAAAARGLAVGAQKINSVDWALGLLRDAQSQHEEKSPEQAFTDAIAALES